MEEKKHNEAGQAKWNMMVNWYSQFEYNTLQSTTTCLAMTEAYKCRSILEVACGPGLHSEFIAKNYL